MSSSVQAVFRCVQFGFKKCISCSMERPLLQRYLSKIKYINLRTVTPVHVSPQFKVTACGLWNLMTFVTRWVTCGSVYITTEKMTCHIWTFALNGCIFLLKCQSFPTKKHACPQANYTSIAITTVSPDCSYIFLPLHVVILFGLWTCDKLLNFSIYHHWWPWMMVWHISKDRDEVMVKLSD